MRVSFVTICICLSLVAFAQSLAQTESQVEILTNDSVVRLIRSGLSPSLVVKMVQDEPGRFNLSSSNIIRLKQQGVPESVLAAMLAKKSGRAEGSDKADRSTAPTRQVGNDHSWEMKDTVDQMSGKKQFSAILSTPALSVDGVREGDYEVEARCNAGVASLRIVFFSNRTPALGFKQNSETYLLSGDFQQLQFAAHHKGPWTETRVRYDENPPFIVTSEKDYTNESEVYFLAQSPRSPVNILDAFGMAMDSIGPNKPAGLEQNLFEAHRLLLESTFADGVKSILDLRPPDPVFQAFGNRCRELIPVPPPPPQVVHTVPQIPVGSHFAFALDDSLNLDGALTGPMVTGRVIEPLQKPSDSVATLFEIPLGTTVVFRVSFVEPITPEQIKRSRNRLNLTAKLDLAYMVIDGTQVQLKTIPLEKQLEYKEPRSTSKQVFGHELGQLAGPYQRKNDFVATAGERLNMTVSETLIPHSEVKP